MLIAQITDVHLGFDGDDPEEPNARRLDAALAAVLAGRPRPDLLLLTGDLTEHGDVAAYRRLKHRLADVPIPAHLCLGNHDLRAGFLEVFGETPTADGFVQYAVETPGLRLLVLDTLEEGRHGGGFCERRAAWLKARLDESDQPTLLVLHHPPIETGVAWMTVGPEEPWLGRLAAAVEGHRQIIGMVCGHIHRPIAAAWRGLPVSVCAATAPQVALDLTPMDPQTPDGRPLIVQEAPAYALHRVSAAGLMSHFAVAQPAPVLARYEAHMQPLMQSLAAERRGVR
jgi:3',5'-cyclic AMP phosphodiesterase CpdA